MTAEDERPLNLRALADIEEPDVLTVALKRFRRRTLVRGAWVAALVLGVLLILPLLRGYSSLPERFYGAKALSSVDASGTKGPVTVTVADVARFDRQTGALHLIASTRTAEVLYISEVHAGRSTARDTLLVTERGDGRRRIAEAFVELPVDTTEITVLVTEGTTQAPDRIASFEITIDLSRDQSLRSLWR